MIENLDELSYAMRRRAQASHNAIQGLTKQFIAISAGAPGGDVMRVMIQNSLAIQSWNIKPAGSLAIARPFEGAWRLKRPLAATAFLIYRPDREGD